MSKYHDHRSDCPFKFAPLDVCDCVEHNMLDHIEQLVADNKSLIKELKICRMAQAVMDNTVAELKRERDHWQDVAGREGVCMACRGPRGAPEPYGCSDCLNTGYCGEWHNEMHELREERERLALAICGGEDAPGYANAQTVETLEKVARDNANATMAQINRTLAAEAKLAKAVEALRLIEADCDADYPPSHLAIKYAARATLFEIEGGVCSSCGEPLSLPSGDGCAAMINHAP